MAKGCLSRVWIVFHKEVHATFSETGKVKTRDLKARLVEISNRIKNSYRGSQEKDNVRKILKGMMARMLDLAQKLANEKYVDGEAFVETYFGSPIVTFDEGFAKKYDMIVQVNTGEIDVWAFFDKMRPVEGLQEDKALAGIACLEAENDFGKKCRQVKISYKDAEEVVDFDHSLRNVVSSKLREEKAIRHQETNQNVNYHPSSVPPKKDPMRRSINVKDKYPQNALTEEKPQKCDKTGYIGWISQKEKDPMQLSMKKREIHGYLREACKSDVQFGDIVVVEDPKNSELRVFCRVKEIRAYNAFARALTKSASEFVIPLIMEPFIQISDENIEPVRNIDDLDEHGIRLPTSDELRLALNLPRTGVPLGFMFRRGSETQSFFYPTSPEDTIYQSMIVTGVQRSGKTNFLKLLVRALASYQGLHPDIRPAIVILDGEHDYKQFAEMNTLTTQAISFLRSHLVGNLEVQSLKISENDCSATLCLNEIDPEDLVYLVPELPTKSADIIQTILRDYCRKFSDDVTLDNLKQAVIDEVKGSQLIHRQQKGAIIRALYSHNLRLLDQPGIGSLKASLMLKAGKVTVIDVFELSDDQKRAVALYLLLLFDKHKMNANTIDLGLILVLDEAHRLFPKKATLLNREYIERVAAKIDNIVHRGRKRKYGVVLATQSPSDVYPLISDLCNTKVAFRLSGADTWVRRNLGKDYIEKVKSLEIGRCIINMAGTGLQIPPIEVQTPNVTDIQASEVDDH